MKRSTIIIIAVIAAVALYVLSFYNGVKHAEVAVTQQWAQVEVAYQARADKSQNLVKIVKGAADYEGQTLKDVVAARSKAVEVKLTGDDLTPEKIKQFEDAQANLGGAIGRLIVEQYPTLQAVKSFQDFQVQYEGMENRIAVERRRFNDVVASYNNRLVSAQGSFLASIFGFKAKTGFESAKGTENAPDIDFGK